jgi:uncharacterized membrane protein
LLVSFFQNYKLRNKGDIMKRFVIALLITAGLFAAAISPSPALAAPADDACAGIKAAGGTCGSGDTASAGFERIIKTVVDILSVIVGAVAVIMIIVGGFRYVISGGDSNGVSGAKNTIMYAIIGLVVVLFAQVIVAFVYSSATTAPAASGSSEEATPETPADGEVVPVEPGE